MRAFTKREGVMLFVLCALIIGALYYFLLLTPILDKAEAANARIITAQETITTEQVRAAKYMQMKKELDVMKSSGQQLSSKIPNYNNLSNVIAQLDSIFAFTPQYDIAFPNITIEERLITRPINITFTAENYESAKTIISALSRTSYRSIMTQVTMTDNAKEDVAANIRTNEVSVSTSINFYERNTMPKPAAEKVA